MWIYRPAQDLSAVCGCCEREHAEPSFLWTETENRHHCKAGNKLHLKAHTMPWSLIKMYLLQTFKWCHTLQCYKQLNEFKFYKNSTETWRLRHSLRKKHWFKTWVSIISLVKTLCLFRVTPFSSSLQTTQSWLTWRHHHHHNPILQMKCRN